MPIPKYNDFMLPLLKLSGDRKEKVFRESVKTLAEEFELTEDEWNIRLKYGQRLVTNRVGWALQELKRALLLESTGRGRFCITDRGMEVLQSSPERIDRAFLTKFEEFREYLKRTPKVFEKNRESDDMAHIETDDAVQSMIERKNDMMCDAWEKEWNTRVDSDSKSRAIQKETWKTDSQK